MSYATGCEIIGSVPIVPERAFKKAQAAMWDALDTVTLADAAREGE
jgi:hypothetical protein